MNRPVQNVQSGPDRKGMRVPTISVSHKILIGIVVLLAATSGWLGYVVAIPAPGRNSVVTPGGQATPCTYDNYQDSGKFVGKDCKTGDNAFVESKAYTLWTDELASGVAEFWEGGTWDWCANGGATPQIIDLKSITIWGVYNQTIFKCSSNSGDALIIGNQNANDALFHAFDIYVHDVSFDGGYPGTGATGVTLGISNAFDVRVDHCIFQNAGNIGGGTVQMAIYNSNQGGSLNTWITNSIFYRQNLSVEGVRNGGVTNSFFYGTAPGVTNQQLVDYSIGDIFPLSVERLEDFHFDNNHVIGWTGTLIEGFQSVSNSTINYNYFGPDASGNSFGATFKVTAVTGSRLAGLTIMGNIFDKGTGTMQFLYGNSITIKDNVWTHDSSPGGCSTAIQINPLNDHSQGSVTNVTIVGNTINAWGGAGMDVNFTRGSISNNLITNVNQGACNANSNAGILVENKLNNVQITGNQIFSTASSGAGVSKPITYNGAATNCLVSNNILIEAADGSASQGFNFQVGKDATFVIRYNKGYVTENQGTAATSSSTTVVVNHGLANMPTSILITAATVGTGVYYVAGITSSQFTITVTNSGTFTFYWQAYYWP